MDRGQTLSEGAVFLASISIAAVVAFAVTALAIRYGVIPEEGVTTADPAIPWEPFAISLALTLVLGLASRAWPSTDRGQITGGPIVPVGFGVAALVAIVVGLEIAEYQRANTPPGADLGAPPTLTIEATALAVVLLLVVLGGVVVLSRRVGE